MIVETDGYIELVQYLTAQLPLFEQSKKGVETADYSLRELFEEQLAQKIMAVCQQQDIPQEVRLDVVREADAVLYDLEEVLSSVLENKPTPEQEQFVDEFIGLVKNLFDDKIHQTISA
ncbi:DUF3802 domain-containing protein [Idiomarina tyrosinivorans]|uniref:DUF3802 domain-containing protein n=1 Tax=Idiomarina tyrosinivorans TaxID=1445662 RepID=A0A432ZF44_9GAMM|nr:DUF3802 family protein [Idiomarina tyrosinivorans]RUO76586.1 DUF3802 domain-containing protein [Idiomarina tyrosinivorans]